MRRFLAVLALCSVAATASALVTRATYLKKNAFRDSGPICFEPEPPGTGTAVVAFTVHAAICPVADPTQLETPANIPCVSVDIPNYPATLAQKNWVKAAWSLANLQAAVPEAAQDAP